MKQITITVPDNCELKQDGNTYTIVEKEEKLTYEDVARVLLKTGYFLITDDSSIMEYGTDDCIEDDVIIYPNNCTSKKQAEKLLAINKLMNVAKYLNGDWQPDWSNEKEDKYFISYNYAINEIQTEDDLVFQNSYIYFKFKELANQAIDILGEETIKLALCTDY